MVEYDSPGRRVVVAEDPDALARLVGAAFLEKLSSCIRNAPVPHVALTGGTMGSAVLRAALEHPDAAAIDWSRVHFWWGDDRFVPADHPDRNAVQAREALLDHIPVPPENIHEMPASDSGFDLDEAAAAYAAELARFGEGDRAFPSFAICFLGVGPDGHIASLFPGRDEIAVVDRAAVAVRDSPKPPPERVSLTLPVLDASKRVWYVLTGEGKSTALESALSGAPAGEVPAGAPTGRKGTVYFVDEAAASGVPASLIDSAR